MKENVTNPTVIWLLLTGISILGGVVVWLALYIRKINNDRIKDQKESAEHIVRLTENNAQVITKMDGTIQMNTQAIQHAGNLTTDAMNRINDTVDDLHKWMIGNMK